ncbi:MAG TPA: DUF47 family protein [Opitutus sp.]|nr:DUF47 family protein [Opitutus sp.]
MLSLKRILGRDEKFYDLLEAGAEEARASVALLTRYVQSLDARTQPATLDDFVLTRRKEKRIRHQMTEELSRTFVTPLEREDIEALSFALYRIPKQVEKIVERLSIYPGRVPQAAFQRQAELMSQAVEAVVFMVKQLRGGTDVEKIREANDRLQFAEGEADKVMLGLLKELYHGPCDAKELVILQELYELVEQAVDRCRNAGNVVVQIVLKYS